MNTNGRKKWKQRSLNYWYRRAFNVHIHCKDWQLLICQLTLWQLYWIIDTNSYFTTTYYLYFCDDEVWVTEERCNGKESRLDLFLQMWWCRLGGIVFMTLVLLSSADTAVIPICPLTHLAFICIIAFVRLITDLIAVLYNCIPFDGSCRHLWNMLATCLTVCLIVTMFFSIRTLMRHPYERFSWSGKAAMCTDQSS